MGLSFEEDDYDDSYSTPSEHTIKNPSQTHADIEAMLKRKAEQHKTIKRNAMGEYIPNDSDGKPLTQLAIPLPGPADYSPSTSLVKPSPPYYSIVGKPKALPSDDFPGPNKYTTSEDMVWRDRGFPLIGKGKEKSQKTCSIGPAAYLLRNDNIGSNHIKSTLSRREKIVKGPPDRDVQPVDSHGFQTPGPYRPNSANWRSNIKKTFGLALKKDTKETDTGPGPAEYSVRTEDRGPAYSLRKRLPQAPVDDNPGPGAYNIPTTIGKSVAKSISSRQPELSNMWAPSPNTYNVPSTIGGGPKYSMTYREFERNDVAFPSPAKYERNLKNLSNQPEYSCKKLCRPVYPDILNYAERSLMKNPEVGPGSFLGPGDFSKNDAPSYSMGKRVVRKLDETPGPASYNVRQDKKKSGACSMGVKLKTRLDTVGPGPSAYNPKKKTTGPQYSMSGRHQKLKVPHTPAANSYVIRSGQTNKGIGKGPKITLKGRPSPFVYSGIKRVFVS